MDIQWALFRDVVGSKLVPRSTDQLRALRFCIDNSRIRSSSAVVHRRPLALVMMMWLGRWSLSVGLGHLGERSSFQRLVFDTRAFAAHLSSQLVSKISTTFEAYGTYCFQDSGASFLSLPSRSQILDEVSRPEELLKARNLSRASNHDKTDCSIG